MSGSKSNWVTGFAFSTEMNSPLNKGFYTLSGKAANLAHWFVQLFQASIFSGLQKNLKLPIRGGNSHTTILRQ